MKNKQSTPQALRRLSGWISLCAALTLTACSSLGTPFPEEQVRQRANERWQALVAGEFTRAYNYNTPAFKAVVTPDAYRTRYGSAVIWVGAEAVKVTCPETIKCIATVRLDFKPLMGGQNGDKIDTHFNETWLLEDGKWWLFEPIKAN